LIKHQQKNDTPHLCREINKQNLSTISRPSLMTSNTKPLKSLDEQLDESKWKSGISHFCLFSANFCSGKVLSKQLKTNLADVCMGSQSARGS